MKFVITNTEIPITENFSIHWYGVIIAIAMLIAIMFAFGEAKRQHLKEDDLMNVILLVIPFGVLGARLYYVALHWDYYHQHLNQILSIWKGGSAIHGAIIAGILVVYLYCRQKRLRFFQWLDIVALVVPLAQGIGRWGNYINSEAYGPVIEAGSVWEWIPFQVWAEGAWHHPCFLYECVWDLLLFAFLFWLIRRPHALGSIFGCYITLYSFGRGLIELLRIYSETGLFRYAASVLSLIGVAGGLLFIVLYLRKKEKVDVAELGCKKHKKIQQ